MQIREQIKKEKVREIEQKKKGGLNTRKNVSKEKI